MERLLKQIEQDRFDLNVEQALVIAGIGERECPTIDKWAAFCVTGGIITALKGESLLLPDPEPPFWVADLEGFTWKALGQAFKEHPTQLDPKFMAATLRELEPREHHAPPDHPYTESYFASHWRYLEYPDTIMHSIGHIRRERIQKGHEALALLPQDVVASIYKVTPHIPPMLKIAITCIEKTYRW